MKVIQIISYETGEPVHEIDVSGESERMIDKIDLGVNINLNHDEYYTIIEEIEDRELIKSH